jgi:hypothetical protein
MDNEVKAQIGGPVSVSYRKQGGKVYCTALQFDLVGVGKTRGKALEELKAVVETYLATVLSEKGQVRFFNFADEEEWANTDQEIFYVTATLIQAERGRAIPREIRPEKIRHYKGRLRSFNLEAAHCIG